jgi:hypothetical protein
MQLDNLCAFILVVGFIAFGAVGVIIEVKLARSTKDLRIPIEESDIQSEQGKKLFRLYDLWKRARIPIWLGSALILWFFCSSLG